MTKLDWTLMCLIAWLPSACAGKLDPHEDYFGDRTSTAIKSPAAGSGNGTAAGSGGARWQDAGVSQAMAQAGTIAPRVIPSSSGSDAAWPQPSDQDDDTDAGTTASQAPAAGSGGVEKDAGPAADSGSQTAACDFKGIVQAKCGNQNCHGAPASNTGLDLTSASLAMRLDGRKGASACTDKLLIDKAHPEDSMLYLKVTGSSCGVRMPLGGSLNASEQACILTWIEGL